MHHFKFPIPHRKLALIGILMIQVMWIQPIHGADTSDKSPSVYSTWKQSGSLFVLTTPEGADLPASASLDGFPLLVRLDRDSIDFQQARPNGEDVRFSLPNGETNEKGAIRPRSPDLLLDAWQAAYNFNHHRITRGHSPARSGEELLHRLANSLNFDEIRWGVTGLGSAWLYSGFAAFRLVTVFLESMPSQNFFTELEFTAEAKGANLWVVLPDDDSVFDGVEKREGISCVSPLQTYLDLKDQPERSKDAAAELRERYLNWDFHAE